MDKSKTKEFVGKMCQDMAGAMGIQRKTLKKLKDFRAGIEGNISEKMLEISEHRYMLERYR